MSQLDAFQQQPSFHPHQIHTQQALFGPGGSPASISSPHAFGQTPTGNHLNRFSQTHQQQQQVQGQNVGRDGSLHGFNPLSGNVQASFQQQQQQQQNQQRQFQQQFPSYQQPTSVGANQATAYTTAGFSQPVTASSGTPLSQGMPGQIASPNQSFTSSPTPAGQAKALAQNTSMPAPPTPQSPQNTLNGLSLPQSPTSVASIAQDKERVALLLDINAELLQEISNLQSQGKGGPHNAQQQEHFRKNGQPDKLASPEYTQTLFRLQANLGYLCGKSDMAQKPGAQAPHPPTFMRPPPNMPGLEPKYAHLRRLFPGWVGRDDKVDALRRSSGGSSAGGQLPTTSGGQ